jgi:hypothetical protein
MYSIYKCVQQTILIFSFHSRMNSLYSLHSEFCIFEYLNSESSAGIVITEYVFGKVIKITRGTWRDHGSHAKGRVSLSAVPYRSVPQRVLTEYQALLRSADLTPPPPPSPLSLQQAPSATNRKTEKERQISDGFGGESGWARRIMRLQESLALYKSFNTLRWPTVPVSKTEVKISRCSSVTRKIFVFFWNKAKIRVAEPWHFGVDPDLNPRIHVSD